MIELLWLKIWLEEYPYIICFIVDSHDEEQVYDIYDPIKMLQRNNWSILWIWFYMILSDTFNERPQTLNVTDNDIKFGFFKFADEFIMALIGIILELDVPSFFDDFGT